MAVATRLLLGALATVAVALGALALGFLVPDTLITIGIAAGVLGLLVLSFHA